MGDRKRMTPRSTGFLLFCCCAFAQNAPKPEMTARELFYSAAQTPQAKPAEAPHKAAAKAPPKVVTAKKTDAPRPEPATAMPQPPASNHTLPGGAKLITASAGMPTSAPPPANGMPLGLKYTVLKLIGSEMREVPTDTTFHSGDHIQFRIETNSPGYLYIVAQGSSGTWKPMFPSPEADGGSNHIEGFHTYTMPQKTRFGFDEQAGTEKLFLIFTREKEADLENMIFDLQSGGKAKPAAPARTTMPAPEASPQLLRASIDDGAIGRLRTTYSRDLVVEAVDPGTPGGEKKESAVYVVNPTGSADSKVVADLLLVHK